MTTNSPLDSGVIFDDKTIPSLDAELSFAVASGIVGIIASLLYVIFELQNIDGNWMELVKWEIEFLVIAILYIFFLCRTQTGQIKIWFEGSIVTLSGVIVVDVYVARWTEFKELKIIYLLFVGIALSGLSLVMVARCLVRKVVTPDDNFDGFPYASSVLTRSKKSLIPKRAISVSLHPSFEVISSQSEPHLRLRSVLSQKTKVTVDNMFISHDQLLSTAHSNEREKKVSKCLKEKKSMDKVPKREHKMPLLNTHPPVMLLTGSLLSLLLLGYLAIVAYEYVTLEFMKDLSEEMSDDSESLCSNWSAVKSSMAELQAALDSLHTKGSLDDLDETALEKVSASLTNSAAMMESSLRAASSDLRDYSVWVDSTRRRLLLAIRIGAGVAIAVGVSCILLPLQHVQTIRKQMQAGTWNFSRYVADAEERVKPRSTVESNSLLSLGSTIMGTQLGLTFASFIAITTIVGCASFVCLIPSIRRLLWICRFHVLVLMVLILLGTIGTIVLQRKYVKSGQSVQSEQTLLRYSTILSFFNIVPCHALGVLRFVSLGVCGICSWGRIDIPASGCSLHRLDAAYISYINMLLLEHQTCNPIVREAAVALASRWQRTGRSRRAELRWFLAYTLIKNPSLIKYRMRRSGGNLSIAKVAKPTYDKICENGDSDSDGAPQVEVALKKRAESMCTPEMVMVGSECSEEEDVCVSPSQTRSKQKSFPETKQKRLYTGAGASAMPRKELSSTINMSPSTNQIEDSKHTTPPPMRLPTSSGSNTSSSTTPTRPVKTESGQSTRSPGIAMSDSLVTLTPSRTLVKLPNSKDRPGGPRGSSSSKTGTASMVSSLDCSQIDDIADNRLGYDLSPPQAALRGYPTTTSSVHSHGSTDKNGVLGYCMSSNGSTTGGSVGNSHLRRAALSRPVSGTTL